MIYFDHAATSKPKEAALEAYLSASRECYGNPESTHAFGRLADRLLEKARKDILACFGLADTHDLVFTSGATEANNLAILSTIKAFSNRGRKVISSYYEHPSVLNCLKALEAEGKIDLVLLRGDSSGKVSQEELAKAIDKDTLFVALMGVNNELGTVSPYEAYAETVKGYPKCFYLMDFTQGAGKMNLAGKDIHFISWSAHKFGGPKGVGGLIYKKNINLPNFMYGGGQEKGKRPGTVDVPSIVASAEALKDECANMKENAAKAAAIRREIIEGLKEYGEDIAINSPVDGSPYILDFSLRKKKASVVVEALSEKEIYVGTFSACSSKKATYSYVLKDSGHSDGDSENSIRLSFGGDNEIGEAKAFLEAFAGIMKEVRDRG